MNPAIALSGIGRNSLKTELLASLANSRPTIIGVASAFVSNSGVKDLNEILQASGRPKCRLIAGTDKAITHPEALYKARNLGWDVRIGKAQKGIFHPKLIVAGKSIFPNGTIDRLCYVYVGSSNLTAGGLFKNLECGLIARDAECPQSATRAFARLWADAQPATDADLRNYAARFAEAARRRKASELDDLGISEAQRFPDSAKALLKEQPPSHPAVSVGYAIAAWAGLQSFTGEYRFQLEFPKAAGIVIGRLLGLNRSHGDQVDIFCPDDSSTRQMRFKFYHDNGMFRLNIPNDAPGVSWARQHKDGIVIIEKGLQGGAPLRMQFIRPGADADEIVNRSVALGTWGRTPTRVYGWY